MNGLGSFWLKKIASYRKGKTNAVRQQIDVGSQFRFFFVYFTSLNLQAQTGCGFPSLFTDIEQHGPLLILSPVRCAAMETPGWPQVL